MSRLTQRFTNPALYVKELERINKRWEQPKPKAADAFDLELADLPHGYSRRATEER